MENRVFSILVEPISFFQMFPPESFNSPREYHATTRGYILNEIFRRVEPSARTMGEFLR